MRSPRFRRTALIVGGAASVGTIGAVAVRYRFYQTIVAQEVEKALKPVHAQLDDLQATVDAMAEAEGIEPEKPARGKSTAAEAQRAGKIQASSTGAARTALQAWRRHEVLAAVGGKFCGIKGNARNFPRLSRFACPNPCDDLFAVVWARCIARGFPDRIAIGLHK